MGRLGEEVGWRAVFFVVELGEKSEGFILLQGGVIDVFLYCCFSEVLKVPN